MLHKFSDLEIAVKSVADAPHLFHNFKLPSHAQIEKLKHGDIALLFLPMQTGLSCQVIFKRGADVLGRVYYQPVNLDGRVKKDDLVYFTTENIFKVDVAPVKAVFDDWVVLTFPMVGRSNEVFVMHTLFPRFIGLIVWGKQITLREVGLIDEPLDYDNDMPPLLASGGNWYFYNYVKN